MDVLTGLVSRVGRCGGCTGVVMALVIVCEAECVSVCVCVVLSLKEQRNKYAVTVHNKGTKYKVIRIITHVKKVDNKQTITLLLSLCYC